MCWLRAWIIELAGAMRLTEAVPLLMDMLNSNHSCSASGALRQIDGDAVLRGIDARWRHTGVKLRRIMADLLTHLRGDHCIELALSFFKRERDQETKLTLAEALLENYYEDALDLASSLAEEVGERKCRRREVDLRYRMVMNSMIMGRTFPQFDKWRKSALRNNWGSLGWPPSRIANSYKPEPFGPKWSEN
jgi:hypothetical protein